MLHILRSDNYNNYPSKLGITAATLLFLLLANLTHAQYQNAFAHDYPQRYKLLDSIGNVLYFYSDSATALKSYEELRKLSRENNDEKALAIADKLEFFYRFTPARLNGSPEQAWHLSERALKIAEAEEFPALLASIHYGLGIYYFDHLRQYTPAFEHFLQAYDIFSKLDVKEFPDKGFYHFDYAMRFYRFGDYEGAIRYATEANQYPYHSQHDVVYNQNLLGMCYFHLQEIDSAQHHFKKALAFLHQLSDTDWSQTWQGILLGNVGKCWYAAHQYDSAANYLTIGFELTRQYQVWDNASGFATLLANIYLKEDRMDQALYFLKEAEKGTINGGDDQNHFELERGYSDYYRKLNNTAAALRHMDSAQAWQARITRFRTTNSKTIAEFRNASLRYKKDLEQTKYELHIQRLVRNSLFGLLFLGLALTTYIIRQRQLNARLREDQLQQKNMEAESALSKARAELERFSKDIHEKNELIETFSKMQATSPMLSEQDTKVVDDLRQSVILTDNAWENFCNNFETVYPGFIQQLKDRHPDCTAAEYRLMILDKLELNNKEMAAMLGISPETIRSTRSRLRRKLGM